VLVLFDIDGTLLLQASADHARSVHDALREVYGVTAVGGPVVEAAGRTDLEIARALALLAGVSARRFEAGLPDFRIAAVAAYARRAPADLSAHVAPGMTGVLETLAAREDVLLSLVTGNLEPIARLKLRAAGLGGFFPAGQGGFGSDSEDRAELPSIARRRAGDATPYPRARTVVVGDTPRDIACARADGVRVVAVATGPYAAGELGGADAVARDAHELLGLL
jgi:phosphoglycolate phosphatase-like HAD superfamily hydrolase